MYVAFFEDSVIVTTKLFNIIELITQYYCKNNTSTIGKTQISQCRMWEFLYAISKKIAFVDSCIQQISLLFCHDLMNVHAPCV